MVDQSRLTDRVGISRLLSGERGNAKKKWDKIDVIKSVPSRYNIEIALNGGGVLLFNSFNRTLCRLTPIEVAIWRLWGCDPISLRSGDILLIRALAADGFVVPCEFDELSSVQNAYFEARGDITRMSLTIAPTMSCNLACGYCFQGLDKDLSPIDVRLEAGILGFIAAKRDGLRELSVTWYGGEPLMARKKLYQIADSVIRYCDESSITYSSMIVTNGYLLTQEVAHELWSRRCGSAQVTIDGVESTHDRMRPLISGRGSYRRIMENLENVLDRTPMRISLRVNVGRRNVGECQNLVDELVSRGFAGRPNFSLYFASIDAATSESGSAREEGMSRREFCHAVLTLGERVRREGMAGPIVIPKGIMGMCVAAQDNGYVITQKGDVHKCWETAHDKSKCIGSIFEVEKLNDSVNGALWSHWSPFDNEVCRNCRILPMCGGFCGHRFVYHGAGNDLALPCPEWKWNTAEYLFSRAKALGAVTDEDWLPSEASSGAMHAGVTHSKGSLTTAQKILLEKVSATRGEHIDRTLLLGVPSEVDEDATPDAAPDAA